MKAKELMIDDWVMYHNELLHNSYPTRVEDGEHIDYIASNANFEPIPLTPEILEKNGFAIKKKWAQMGNFGDSPLIMWHFEDEPILRQFKHELEIHQNDTGKVHIHIPCEYVHQLQHALKLCGINKNIEL